MQRPGPAVAAGAAAAGAAAAGIAWRALWQEPRSERLRELELTLPGWPAALDRLGALRAPLGVVAVLGNHDWRHDGPRVRAALRNAGIPVLENDAMSAGAELWVAGVEDSRHRRPDVGRALRDVPDGAPVILMAHDPDLFPQVPARVALTVSGHLHGGHVGVPLVRRPFLPSRFGERYARGHKVEGGRHLYVTSGIGTTGWPVRLLAPPEIVGP